MQEIQKLCQLELSRQQQAIKQQQKTLQQQEQQSLKTIQQQQQQSLKDISIQQQSLKELHRQQHAWLDVQVKQHAIAAAAIKQHSATHTHSDNNRDSTPSSPVAQLSHLSPAKLQSHAIPASTMLTGNEKKQLRHELTNQLQLQMTPATYTPPSKRTGSSHMKSPNTAPITRSISNLQNSVTDSPIYNPSFMLQQDHT